jgi:hypothetical protein
MKTTLKTVVSTALVALVLSASAFTTVAAEKVKVLEMASVNPAIKKIIISGNVKVMLVQSYNEQVALDEENFDKVSIKQVGYTLNISSDSKTQIQVTVFVSDPYRIDASNNACVSTVGRFDVKHLQVMVRDNAVASIKAKTESLYTVVNGNASLELKGSTANHIIKTDGIAILKTEGLAALKTDRISAETDVAMNKKPSASIKK